MANKHGGATGVSESKSRTRPRSATTKRKNNPFSNPEEKVLERANMHGARFTFNGFYGTGNNWHEPIYELITPICDIQYIVTLGQFQRV